MSHVQHSFPAWAAEALEHPGGDEAGGALGTGRCPPISAPGRISLSPPGGLRLWATGHRSRVPGSGDKISVQINTAGLSRGRPSRALRRSLPGQSQDHASEILAVSMGGWRCPPNTRGFLTQGRENRTPEPPPPVPSLPDSFLADNYLSAQGTAVPVGGHSKASGQARCRRRGRVMKMHGISRCRCRFCPSS